MRFYPIFQFFIFKKANDIKGSFFSNYSSWKVQSKACYHTDLLRVLLGSICIFNSCHLCLIKILNVCPFVCCNQYTNTALCEF